jgi:hypothetical protein
MGGDGTGWGTITALLAPAGWAVYRAARRGSAATLYRVRRLLADAGGGA